MRILGKPALPTPAGARRLGSFSSRTVECIECSRCRCCRRRRRAAGRPAGEIPLLKPRAKNLNNQNGCCRRYLVAVGCLVAFRLLPRPALKVDFVDGATTPATMATTIINLQLRNRKRTRRKLLRTHMNYVRSVGWTNVEPRNLRRRLETFQSLPRRQNHHHRVRSTQIRTYVSVGIESVALQQI